MGKPLISILIPFKNTQEFLAECLDSILAQTYSNWELLIVDDHSVDESYDVVLAYAEIDKRIKLYKNDSFGIIPALRKAYQNSNGDYITRMDSDDLMMPEKLELMLKDLQTFGKEHIALGLVSYFSEKGVGMGYKSYEMWLNSLTRAGRNYSEIYKECVIPSPCWMVNREDLESCGAFRSDIYPEDYDLAFRFFKNSLKCIPSRNLLHYWRDHDSRASRTDAHYAENNFLELKINYFVELDYHSEKLLAIWGAGKKGKKIARILHSKNIPFKWYCDNPKKIGKHIYNVLLEDARQIENLKNPQIVIAVSNPDEQRKILSYLENLKLKGMEDFYFFC